MISGCDALSNQTPAPDFAHQASTLVTPSGVAFSQSSSNQILESAIDPNDSYILANFTVQPTPPADNPLGLTFPVESHRVETGYTTGGDIVFTDYRTDPPANPLTDLVDEVRTVRMIGYDVLMYDVNGQPYPIEDPNLVASVQELLEEDGTQVTDGFVLDELAPPAAGGPAESSAASADVRVLRTAQGGRLETVTRTQGRRQRTEKTYKRKGNVYVLESLTTTLEDERGRVAGGVTISVSNVSWKRNAGKDTGRRSRRGQPMRPRPNSGGQHALSECDPARPGVVPEWCEDTPIGGGTGYDPCPHSQNGPRLAFQHGILSNGSAWGNTTPGDVMSDVRCAFNHTGSVALSMPQSGLGSHRSQIDHFKSNSQIFPGVNAVLVGHSQGGIVLRRTAQEWQQANAASPGSAPTALAVVTLNTPHTGALIADNLSDPVKQVAFTGAFLSLAPLAVWVPARFRPSVGVLVGGLYMGPPPFNDGTAWGSPAIQDLKQQSASVETMNAGYESFYRIGIRNTPSKRWGAFRLAGDADREGGGAIRVRKAQNTYSTMKTLSFAGMFIPTAGWLASAAAITVMVLMNASDAALALMSSGFRTSDGIVTGAAQVYPNTPGRYTPVNYNVINAVSHTGVQRSNEAAEAVVRLLTQSDQNLPQRSQP